MKRKIDHVRIFVLRIILVFWLFFYNFCLKIEDVVVLPFPKNIYMHFCYEKYVVLLLLLLMFVYIWYVTSTFYFLFFLLFRLGRRIVCSFLPSLRKWENILSLKKRKGNGMKRGEMFAITIISCFLW